MLTFLASLFIFTTILNLASFGIQVYYAVMYSDLEADYINPVDLCAKVNPFIVPEIALHAFTSVLLLPFGAWLTFLVNVPLLYFNYRKMFGQKHKSYKLDPTEIFRTLKGLQTECYVKIGFHLFMLFFYIFKLIFSLD